MLSTKILLNKSHSIIYPSRFIPIQARLRPGAPDSHGFPCWGCANLCSLTPEMSWHAQFTSLYYRRQVTPGCRSCALSILDKNLYFCAAVEFRHTLLVIQGSSTGCDNQPPFLCLFDGFIQEIAWTQAKVDSILLILEPFKKNKVLLLGWIELNAILEVLFFSHQAWNYFTSLTLPNLSSWNRMEDLMKGEWSSFWHKVPEFNVRDKFGVLSSWGLPLFSFIDSAIHSLLF